MPLSEELLKNNSELWEELGVEFGKQQAVHGNIVSLNEDKKLPFPSPWVEDMMQDLRLGALVNLFHPIGEDLLAPMSQRMRDICKVLSLPTYTGKLVRYVGVSQNTVSKNC